MNEAFSWNYEQTQTSERNNEHIISSLSDWKKEVQEKATYYYLENKNNPETVQSLRELIERQEQERTDLKESLEKQVIRETKEELDKELLTNETKELLYEKLWIDNNQEANSSFENFLKWFVDEAIVWNYELAIEVYNTWWEVIIESLKQLASLEWLKQVAEALWKSIWDLFTWDAYEKWQSFAELWLLTLGVWVTAIIWKKWIEVWLKNIRYLKANKENLVSSEELKLVISETNSKIDWILPKRELDFEKALKADIGKLWDADRIESWKVYLWRELTKEQEVAIIKAHNIWKDRGGAGIYNYTFREKWEKLQILKEAWFSKKERKLLLEKWVCWLFNEYKFLKQARYSELVEELWDIDVNQVVWEWVNALVINNLEDPSFVRKISKIWRDDIVLELENHNKLYNILEDLKDKKIISANIKIPEVFEIWNEVSFFMEKVPGHTPKSDFYLSLYKNEFIKKWFLVDDLPSLSDQNINQFLKENRLQRLPEPDDRFITPNEIRMEKLLQNWWDKKYNSEWFKDIRDALKQILEEWKINIWDRNPWNFIITPDWKIYIIDFWQISI